MSKTRRTYRSFRPTARALSRVLTVEELGRVVACSDMAAISELWSVKHAEIPEPAGGKLRRRIDVELRSLHGSLLRDLQLHLALGPEAMVHRHLPLAARDPLFVVVSGKREPVSLIVGNGESSEYRETIAQGLMLITGAERCLESVLTPGPSGVAKHSARYRERDIQHIRALSELVRHFFKSKPRPGKTVLFHQSATSGRTKVLRSRKDLDLVRSLDEAREWRSGAERRVDSIETAVLKRLAGAERARLSDGSEIVVTGVHRDAHYVSASDYQQLRHVYGEEED